MSDLFDPLVLGAIHTPNRIFMAPLTRGRSTRDHVPTPVMVDYYAQRASAGLIVSEATGISVEGSGWPYAPGLWNDEQIEGWKPVTDAVHRAGGRIVAQLWHMGRLVHPSLHGVTPVSSSAVPAPGDAHTYDGKSAYVTPRAATRDDIARILDDYARAARHALTAGFDGVQLHAANGYLIDQFLRDGVNARTDEYGGSPENRARLLREAVGRLIGEVGADRTAVRFSPNGDSQGTDDSDPEAVFVPAARWMSEQGIAFLELREQAPDSTFGRTDVPKLSPAIREVFTGPLVLNQDYDLRKARAGIASGLADAITFGRPFIANPDLVERLRTDAPLATPNSARFYSQGPKGYIDYPALREVEPA